MRKKLIAVFQKPSPNNDYARSIVQLKVFNELSLHYDITDIHPKDLNIPEYKGSPGSIDSVQNMTIINPENNTIEAGGYHNLGLCPGEVEEFCSQED